MSRNEHKLGSWEQENAEDNNNNNCDSDIEGSTYSNLGISAPCDLQQPQAHITVTDADLHAMVLYWFTWVTAPRFTVMALPPTSFNQGG